MISITSFTDEYRFLSNFYSLACTSLTTEHLYQASKCVRPSQAQAIMDAHSPGAAKRLGQHVALRPDWEDVKLPIMRLLVTVKFMSSLELGARLMATGDARLIEGNTWHDNFWGMCVCANCAGRDVESQNHLGLILMDVRQLVLENSKIRA